MIIIWRPPYRCILYGGRNVNIYYMYVEAATNIKIVMWRPTHKLNTKDYFLSKVAL